MVDGRASGVGRCGPAHIQAGGASRGRLHGRRRRRNRRLVLVRDRDRHVDGVAVAGVGGLDGDGIAGVGFMVVGHARFGLDLPGARHDVERRRVGAFQRVGQRVIVVVGGGHRGANGRVRRRVLDHAAIGSVVGEHGRVVGDARRQRRLDRGRGGPVEDGVGPPIGRARPSGVRQLERVAAEMQAQLGLVGAGES